HLDLCTTDSCRFAALTKSAESGQPVVRSYTALVDGQAHPTQLSVMAFAATPNTSQAWMDEMPKFLLFVGLRSILVVTSLLAISAIAFAQHPLHDHTAPAGGTTSASRDQVLAQASPPPTQRQPGSPTVPGMTMTGRGDMHAPVVITLRSGIA